MNYVFDIDGTLSFDGKSIHEDIVDALIKLSEKNTIIFASARPIRDMLPILPKDFHNNLLIGGNGAFKKFNNSIVTTDLDKTITKDLYNHIHKHNYNYMVDSDWNYAYKGSKDTQLYNNITKDTAKNIPLEELQKICKVVIFSPTQDTLDFLTTLDVEITFHTSEDLVDISSKGCSKHNALKKHGISNYIAFGNDANDVGMFKNATVSYCVDESEYAKYAHHTITRDRVCDTLLSLL